MGSSYCDEVEASILTALHHLVPRPEMHAVLDNLATGRIGANDFADFVWHTMAKSAAEKIFDRRWQVLEADSRRKAARMAVIYVMHCLYEQAATGKSKLSLCQVKQPEWLLYKAG